MDYNKIVKRIVSWLREKVEGASRKGGVIGLSGGIDSSVSAALCKKAFGDKCLGLLLPCRSKPEDLEDAKKVAEHLGIKTIEVNLTPAFEALVYEFENESSAELEKNPAIFNIKPRLRMTALYYFAAKMNYLVIGTGNKSEIYMGYFTKYGDGGVDLEPIGDLTKTEIYKLAEILEIPKEIINRVPTAGLYDGQTDEGEMGITYGDLDYAIECIESGNTGDCDDELLGKVKSQMSKMEHKTKPPPILKLTR